mmetsp:Transcript_91952/g.238269  ORF Transcript_91952/g.238269 Transcript_91952/m.238269 type:complete len:227 (+) Transcript_91952:394-1074(+)
MQIIFHFVVSIGPALQRECHHRKHDDKCRRRSCWRGRLLPTDASERKEVGEQRGHALYNVLDNCTETRRDYRGHPCGRYPAQRANQNPPIPSEKPASARARSFEEGEYCEHDQQLGLHELCFEASQGHGTASFQEALTNNRAHRVCHYHHPTERESNGCRLLPHLGLCTQRRLGCGRRLGPNLNCIERECGYADREYRQPLFQAVLAISNHPDREYSCAWQDELSG